MTTANLAANQQRYQTTFQALRQRFVPPQVSPPNATIVRLERLRCRFPDDEEARKVREIREWCKENCEHSVHIEWDYEAGFFTPVAHCAHEVDAVHLALRWV
jgi:hypothetical protein